MDEEVPPDGFEFMHLFEDGEVKRVLVPSYVSSQQPENQAEPQPPAGKRGRRSVPRPGKQKAAKGGAKKKKSDLDDDVEEIEVDEQEDDYPGEGRKRKTRKKRKPELPVTVSHAAEDCGQELGMWAINSVPKVFWTIWKVVASK